LTEKPAILFRCKSNWITHDIIKNSVGCQCKL